MEGKNKANYMPLIFEEEGLETGRQEFLFSLFPKGTVADAFYIRSVSREKKTVPVMPDSCMSLVFRGKDRSVSSYICGVTDEIKKLVINPGECYIFIKFIPGAGFLLTKEPASSIANRAVPLKEETGGNKHPVSRARAMLREMTSELPRESNIYLIKRCTDRILREKGNIRIEDLAAETGVTSRYIGKVFEKYVGLSPKIYSQIIRLRFSMEKILEERDRLLVDIATDSGFFDHAHMNRMYKKLIHRSSGDFRKNLFKGLDYSKVDDYISAV